MRQELVVTGYSMNSAYSPNHECYERKVDSLEIVFLVHLPSKKIIDEKPVQEWLLTMYAAPLNRADTQHTRIAERIYFGTNFIRSGDSRKVLLQEEKRLIHVIRSNAFKMDKLWRMR